MWLLLRGSDLAVTARVKPRSWWCPSKQTSPSTDHSLGRECWLAERDSDIWVLAQPLVSRRCVLLGKDFSIHFFVFTPCQQAPSLSPLYLWLLPCSVPGISLPPPTALLHPPSCAPRTPPNFPRQFCPHWISSSLLELTARAPLLVPLISCSSLKIFPVSNHALGHKSTGWQNSPRGYTFTHAQR